MNRVLVARSLKFSEHRSNEAAVSKDSGKSEVFVHKKSEISKSKADGGKLRAAFSTSVASHDKLKTPTIVAGIIQKESKEKKKLPRGVWSPLGEIYSTHGMPDLELGEEAKIDNKKVKKPRRVKEAMQERQKLEDLMDLFRTTKSSLQAVNLFNRPGEDAHGLLPSVPEKDDRGSRESTPRGNREEHAFHRSKDVITTRQKISMLGSVSDNRKQRAKKKKPIDKKVEQINHLKEGRESHLSRWRGGFEETKSAMDRALIQKLVKRAEDKDMVYDNQKLMGNALDICEQPHFTNKAPQYSIWERARIKGMNARNDELQQQAARIKENAQKQRRTPSSTLGGRDLSPRLMMRSASQPEFNNSRPLSNSSSQPTLRAGSRKTTPEAFRPKGGMVKAH